MKIDMTWNRTGTFTGKGAEDIIEDERNTWKWSFVEFCSLFDVRVESRLSLSLSLSLSLW